MAGLKRRGWLWRGNGELPRIEPGSVFRRLRAHNLVETARVLAVTTDTAGIPHVRVVIEIEGPAYARSAGGQRLISLAAFVEEYAEQVEQRR